MSVRFLGRRVYVALAVVVLAVKRNKINAAITEPVSYTHLDVYKRQRSNRVWHSCWADSPMALALSLIHI